MGKYTYCKSAEDLINLESINYLMSKIFKMIFLFLFFLPVLRLYSPRSLWPHPLATRLGT